MAEDMSAHDGDWDDLIVIDGLQVHRWTPELLRELHNQRGVTAFNASSANWEDARATLSAIGHWRYLFDENDDVVMQIRKVSDIHDAKATNRIGIILGFQNASPIEDELNLIAVYHDLGVRVMQLTYNNQNAIGAGCYEDDDGGLRRFGREVIREMNRVGTLIDLSHVGERTSLDSITLSDAPVAVTHAHAASVVGDVELRVRTKSDQVLKELAARRGVLGLALYPRLLPPGCTLRDFCDIIERTVEIVGIDHIAIGSDFCLNLRVEDIQYVRSGRWTRDVPQVKLHSWPEWCRTPGDYPNVFTALRERGFSSSDIALIAGGNWLRLFDEVWQPK